MYLTLSFQVNSDIEVEVNITEHTPSIIYQVVGRGDVLLANTVSVRNSATMAAFRFQATASMAPKSKLIVYYVREDGELVADTVDIEIDSVLQNFVSFIAFLKCLFFIKNLNP